MMKRKGKMVIKESVEKTINKKATFKVNEI
jgi:hypothetical protein